MEEIAYLDIFYKGDTENEQDIPFTDIGIPSEFPMFLCIWNGEVSRRLIALDLIKEIRISQNDY
jgi:hypothetical protein